MGKSAPLAAPRLVGDNCGCPNSARRTPAVADVDDTYSEAFRSNHAEILITSRDRTWLDHAVRACTGNASSMIVCDCEAGLDRYVDAAETPDRRPSAVVQFHIPRVHKDRAQRLERSLLVRVSQNVLMFAERVDRTWDCPLH